MAVWKSAPEPNHAPPERYASEVAKIGPSAGKRLGPTLPYSIEGHGLLLPGALYSHIGPFFRAGRKKFKNN